MAPEAALEQTPEGKVPAGAGWFVLNAREAAWRRRPGRGHSVSFTGYTDEHLKKWFPQLGVNLLVLEPGEPIGQYHWEADQEGFLILSGEALLIVEGQEWPLRQWDYVHCPAGCAHMIVGAGDRPCALVAAGSREKVGTPEWGAYTFDETAHRHGACVEEETSDAAVAYAPYPAAELTRYRAGLLPGD